MSKLIVTDIETQSLIAGGTITAAAVSTPQLLTTSISASSLALSTITATSIAASGTVQASSFIGNGIMPTGTVVPFAGITAPSGWLFCFGQGLSTSTYATLFSVLDYRFGGSGATFFLPDLRGRVVAGKDDMGGTSAGRLASVISGGTLGAAGGADIHQLTVAEMPLHGHPYRASYASQTGAQSSSTGGFLHFTATVSTQGPYTGIPSNSQGQGIGGEGGNGSHNNLQPTIVLNYIIKV